MQGNPPDITSRTTIVPRRTIVRASVAPGALDQPPAANVGGAHYSGELELAGA